MRQDTLAQLANYIYILQPVGPITFPQKTQYILFEGQKRNSINQSPYQRKRTHFVPDSQPLFFSPSLFRRQTQEAKTTTCAVIGIYCSSTPTRSHKTYLKHRSRMATPLSGDGVLALIPQEPVNSIDPATPCSSSTPAASSSTCMNSGDKSPIFMFMVFQKAIRSELEQLHRAAIAFATDGVGDLRWLSERCRFLFDIYKHHCNAEDAVIFPALDIRVKNVARTYSLEHERENDLFSQLFDLLSSNMQGDDRFLRELASRTGAIKTSLNQHMSKEEQQ
ncbi:zinc finger protein BRUTUS-like, partial [Phalaenopsis equestris]|uniref:zinc finger protein BRUTUS-like n=1 Tax=Phalaenopsis equestris TaxID=78828 RepID=UPI0009E4E24B